MVIISTLSQLVLAKALSRSPVSPRLSKRSLTLSEADFDENGSPKPEIATSYLVSGNDQPCLCQKQPMPFYKIINYK